MTDPLDTNDDWAELARELERDKPPSPPPPADMVERQIEAEATEPHHGDPRGEEESPAEGEPESGADEEFDDADDAASVESGEPNAEGEQPGTGRKRRRRRRRRRKGGAPGEVAAVLGASSTDAPADDAEVEVVAETEDEPAGETDTELDFEEAEENEGEPLPLAAEEDTASEVLRDLIATWNVPSWDDIVSGLYRPG
jgi:hypothetical protein